MAWIEKKMRSDGGVSARVVWRLGGTRGGAYQSETFSAGTDAQNVARADGFKKMVDAGGHRWPDGWVKGEGFVRPAGTDPLTAPPRFVDLGEEYVRQIVDLSPGQRKRYLGHLKVLGETRVRASLLFTKPVTAITEADLKEWLIDWDRSLKTKANYHGLIHGVFAYAVKRGYLAANPAVGTAPRQSRVKQSRPELRFLTERELETAARLAGAHGDLLSVTVGTGLRFGEVSALWVADVDLDHRTIRINKAWKRNGEDNATDTPAGWPSSCGPSTRCVTTTSGIRRLRSHGAPSPSRPQWPRCCGDGSRASGPKTSCSPPATGCRCTTVTSTPTSGASS
ncbi:MAG: site-specific integrase [Actinomycetota bacterium]|nr:site-specific integrase [Actinomycetota bacterium]MDQ3627294.1 site-specific integrase [Actinomycetota bacterium]